MSNSNNTYLVVEADLRHGHELEHVGLAGMTERHKVIFAALPSVSMSSPLETASGCAAAGIILSLAHGLPGRMALELAGQALNRGLTVFLYWPAEQAVEKLDVERLKRYRLHRWAAIIALQLRRAATVPARLKRLLRRLVGRALPDQMRSNVAEFEAIANLVRRRRLAIAQLTVAQGTSEAQATAQEWETQLRPLLEQAAPVAFPERAAPPSPQEPMLGTGAYLRLDFWAPLSSGGSYGHSCYVAKFLAESSADFVSIMANRFALLDELGIRQLVVTADDTSGTEINLLFANDEYYQRLRTAIELARPSYIYERIVLGSFVGARLSQELSIPYIVEYNGSEISMKRSFEGQGYQFEAIYELAEELAFRQASVISVVSEPIRESLVKRGVDPVRIVVNPNGADTEAYAPPLPTEREALRHELGFSADACVVGFTGTFGGWHGIDVLAAALPQICAALANVRFLLIGDGNYKSLIDDAIAQHGLADRCVVTGRIPQHEGARLMKACDIFVSPHSSHMVDSRFFGSPTKLFEYMAIGGGIVASNLEQIGEVLRPALKVADLEDTAFEASDQRAVLCQPGDTDEFVAAVIGLARRSDICQVLGRNARQAVLDEYSWQRHVERLWNFIFGTKLAPPATPRESTDIHPSVLITDDSYKDEVQKQWNLDACGSHYVANATKDSLQWYLNAKRYRYEEYGPWMPEVMEFAGHAGEQVLEIGAGMGTDLAQFARHGAETTDLDLSAGHLQHARRNFELRGLQGRFVHDDAERIPFEDDSFDVVYSNGVIHHTPNTAAVIEEMWRVLKPGGRIIVMVYAEDSYHYWRQLFWELGIKQDLLAEWSMGEIMSRHVEISSDGQKPLVKVYTRTRLAAMFARFNDIEIHKRQLTRAELPRLLQRAPLDWCGRVAGWNLIIKANKPRN